MHSSQRVLGSVGVVVSSFDERTLRSAFNASVCMIDYRVARRCEEGLVFEGASLGGLDIYRYETPVARGARRTVGHIREDGVDDFLLSLPINAGIELVQGGVRTRVEPGSFAFLSTSKPFESSCLSSSHSEYFIKVSGTMLRGRVPYIDDCCAKSSRIRPGAGAMLSTLFELALQNGEALPSQCSNQLGKTVIETIASAALEAPELSALMAKYRRPGHRRICEDAMEYIECRLSDSNLGVADVASHCGISTRSLHGAFAEMGVSVGSYIREERLQRCREAFKHPMLHGKAIIEIAMKWGFNDAAHFSNLYKARFGQPPSKDRLS